MEAEFDAIDTNGGGMILFQEFTNWAFSKNFDLEDDIDSQADEEEDGDGEQYHFELLKLLHYSISS